MEAAVSSSSSPTWLPSPFGCLLLVLKSVVSLSFLLRILQAFKRPSPSSSRKLRTPQKNCATRDSVKANFLSLYKGQYGYPAGPTSIDKLRAKEFARLKGEVYLDHAGATLYAGSQISCAMEDLQANLYGNPHSQSACSSNSSNGIALARQEVLNFFNAQGGEYSCVFTSGATAALKLVGENFPWSTNSVYLYTMENHNSVLGIREYALAAGATVHAVDIEEADDDQLDTMKLRTSQKRNTLPCIEQGEVEETCNLFSFPSECNFSGKKFDLALIKSIKDGRHNKDYPGRWMVLVDAAKGCGTSQFDLTKYPADFVAISFYKIFGYPTGLGALLIRNDSAKKLQKRYFGGGTVAASIADRDFVQKRETIEQWLEDGTVSFLSISSLYLGFAALNRIGISNISMHVGCLAKFTASQLAGVRHRNGSKACVLYGRHESGVYWGDNCKQGPIVTFNLQRSDGTWVGHKEVEKLASLSGIHLRTGCFCNPGACSKCLGLSEAELIANLEAGHVCWDDQDIIGGKPTGAIRVSFGYMSTIEDSLTFLDFIRKFFVDDLPMPSRQLSHKGDTKLQLDSIILYPIKSCGGFSVDSWPLGDCGLLYDREWLVMGAGGDALTQKKCSLMCQIGTHIDLPNNKLFVSSPNMEKGLEIFLEDKCQSTVDVRFNLCGNSTQGKTYEEKVAQWFTKALGTACALVRREPTSRQVGLRSRCDFQTCRRSKELSFANEGQFLMVSRSSVDDLNCRSNMQVDVMRFRPNFVISGGYPFDEDGWHSVKIGREKFLVLGGCNRCQMINIDQNTGRFQEGSNPLLTLASYRRFKGKILFGVLLIHDTFQKETRGGVTDFMGEVHGVVSSGSPIYPERIN